MKEKKNIDRIFQEKFKDFEQEPDEKLWGNIASKLDNKTMKDSPVMPLWLKLGSVAAVLALVVASLLFIEQNDPFTNDPGVVFENPEVTKDNNKSEDNSGQQEAGIENSSSGIAVEDDNIENEISESGKDNSESNNRSSTSESGSSVIEKNKAQTNIVQKSNRDTNSSTSAIASNNTNSSRPQNEKEKGAILPEADNIEASGQIAFSDLIEADSLNLGTLLEEKNALAQIELEKNKAEELEENSEENFKKVRLSTFAAPLFYKNIGSGNELSNQFANNGSSSEVTFTYGVKVAYQISKKLRIRTGISKLDMSYNIQDISYSPSAMSLGFENIIQIEENIEIRDNSPSPAGTSESGLPMGGMSNNNSLAIAVVTPGEINQQFGYIEVPLEIEYALINKRFGLNIIGGGSSLFLDNNRVDLVSGENKTTLGKASNINSTSFSTNIGLGMDYNLTDKFSISVEPIFKYQLSTFDNVQNVQPTNFGIYSGLNFKF